MAVWLALKSVCKEHRSKYIQVRCDNSCSVAYLNVMGGVKSINAIVWRNRFGFGILKETCGYQPHMYQDLKMRQMKVVDNLIRT